MSQTLTSKVQVQLTAVLANMVGVASINASLERSQSSPLASGTGASQADKVYSESAKSVAASGTYDLDLDALTDPFGAALSFARLKAIAVFADSGNINDVLVGAAPATEFVGPFGETAVLDPASNFVRVRPGGLVLLFAPDATAWPVVANASDHLRFTNSAGSTAVVFDIVLLGASA